jgi:hypothetical protein
MELLRYYNGVLQKAVQTIYQLPSKKDFGFWTDIKNQKAFFDEIAEDLGIDTSKPDQLANISKGYVLSKGTGPLNHFNGSLNAALSSLYPGFSQFVSRRESGHWHDIQNQRDKFDKIAQELELDVHSNPELWYSVKGGDIAAKGGRVILNRYRGSMLDTFRSLYPEVHWRGWLFQQTPKGFWNNDENVKEYLEWAAHQLHIKKLDEWHSVSSAQFCKIRGFSLITKYGGIIPLLRKFYPEHPWGEAQSINSFAARKKTWGKGQMLLHRRVKDILLAKTSIKAEDIRLNYRHQDLLFLNSQQQMELDIYIPSLALAFEYQVQFN